MAAFRIVSGSAPPSDSPAPQATEQAVQRCPRCGGLARARQRRATAGNPFLSKKKEPSEITCDDCGLDFEPPGAEAATSSKRSPWSRP
jgi:transcription elongation factor Elf1